MLCVYFRVTAFKTFADVQNAGLCTALR